MFLVAEVILFLIGLLLAVPVLVVFLQVLLALPRRPEPKMPEGGRGRVAVLVPAHNEELVIGETLASISRQLETGDRLVVVADNCSDRTAEIARERGAEVTIRTDTILRGKGFALDHGVRFLQQTGIRETVIFIDADCKLENGCIYHLAQTCARSKRPTQAADLVVSSQPPREMGSLILFAWKLKNLVRPLGWHRLNLPCQLAGTGMAFPWEVIRSINLANARLAEDLKLGLDLALMGHFPQFCPDAVVTSNVGPGGVPSYSQRARWEHGTIEMMAHYLPRLFTKSYGNHSIQLVAMALDLSVPPIALFALILGVYLALTWILQISGVNGPAIMSSILFLLFFASIVLAWLRFGREILPLRRLVFVAPVYLICKVPLYARFFVNRQREWVRGERELGG
jgi:cellulose synthase/poly-beta-1,6-N-acetylglucosamine synthase-like glycosyltransferase